MGFSFPSGLKSEPFFKPDFTLTLLERSSQKKFLFPLRHKEVVNWEEGLKIRIYFRIWEGVGLMLQVRPRYLRFRSPISEV
jgi:hypothetical protein